MQVNKCHLPSLADTQFRVKKKSTAKEISSQLSNLSNKYRIKPPKSVFQYENELTSRWTK